MNSRNKPQRILVRAPNWIGDQVLAYPFFHFLRKAYPQAHITVACVPWVRELQFLDLVNEVHVLSRPMTNSLRDRFTTIEADARSLKKGAAFDLSITLPNSLSSAWLTFRAGSKRRRGYRYEGRGLLLNEGTPWPENTHVVHRAQSYVDLLPEEARPRRDVQEFWGIPPENDLDQPIPGELKEFDVARSWPDFTPLEPPQEPYWVLAPGATADSRRWPVEYFIQLAEKIHRQTGWKGLIVGGPKEAPLAARLCADERLNLIDMTARGPVPVLSKIFKNARFTVCNESGLAHVASFCGSFTQIVCGAADPRRTRPLGPGRVQVAINPVECWPCEKNTCSQVAEKKFSASVAFSRIQSGRRSIVVSNADPKPRAELSELVAALKGQMKGMTVCLSHSWGGLEQVAAADTVEITQQGLEMRALVLKNSPIHEHLSKHPDVKLEVLDYRPRDYFDFKLKNDLKRLCDPIVEGVNVIHLHQTSLLGSVTPWLWNRPDITVFASRHIMNSHDKRNFFHRLIYGRLDALIVMSQTLRKNVMATHPLRERQVKVVNLGLDFDRYDPARVNARRQRAEWGADEDTVVIGLVGRIDPAKGQGTFIKAAAGLTKRLPEGKKLKFVIVGEETLGRSSGYKEELQAMVTQFRLEDSVVFAGFQQNIPEVMRAFDIFVMPSRQEAFGLVAIEAMAMECPIIISRGGSAAEIIGQEEYGLLMRPEDAFDLQRQMRFMVDHPAARREMGVRARTHVKEHYDRNIRLRRTLEIYERALRRRAYQ